MTRVELVYNEVQTPIDELINRVISRFELSGYQLSGIKELHNNDFLLVFHKD